MYALVVDDEKRARETILQIIKLFCPELREVAEADSVKTALESIKSKKPDLIFLDIRLGDGSGFDVLKQTAGQNLNVIITTAYDEYAVKAFKYSAIEYLLKPIDPDDLIEAVEKASSLIQNKKLNERIELFLSHAVPKSPPIKKITLTTTDSIHIVNIEDIIFCEADRNYTTFYLPKKEKILVSKSLKEYEELLPSEQFLRCHQSFLVNLNHITRYEKADNYLVCTDEHHISVSLRKKEQLMQFLKKLG